MYNYLYYDLCAVLAMATLVLALIVRKLTKGRNNHVFLVLCVVILLSGLLDIVTELLDNIPSVTDYYTMLRVFLDTIYFLLQNLCIPIYLFYSYALMGLSDRLIKKTVEHYMWLLPLVFDAVVVLSTPFTHYVFYIDSDLKYHHGPLWIVLYFIAFYYTLFTVCVLIRYKKLLTKGRFVILLSFIILNALAVVLQVIAPEYRVQIFAQAIFTVAVTTIIHRPEDMIDSVVGIQSSNAFMSVVKTNFAAQNNTNYMFIQIDRYSDLRKNTSLDTYLYMLRFLAAKIEKVCQVMTKGMEVYYLDLSTFAIVDERNQYDQLFDIGQIVMSYLKDPISLKGGQIELHPYICTLRCPTDINNEVSLLNFASTFRKKIAHTGKVISLSQISDTKDFRIRNEMDDIIKRGIENHSFEMYYQPIYSLKEKRFNSAEALIRLYDSQYGFVSPGLFIPASEESGAIHDIGDYVIDEVCRFVGSEEFKSLGLDYIEMNLSVAQLLEIELYDKLITSMKKYGVRPEQLNLEITETATAKDPAMSDANIERLHKDGLSFSLDDYGTGYSSISRIVSLPVDIVKLDKSLVDEMDSPEMWIVIRNTVNMLKMVNKKILVEGVEDKRALDRFSEIGCDYIQGYYFSKPLAVKALKEFLCQS